MLHRVSSPIEFTLTFDDAEQHALTSREPAQFSATSREALTCIPQRQTNWCWAACIEMILVGLGRRRSQGLIVNAALGETSCATNGASRSCNKTINVVGESPNVEDALTENGLSGQAVNDSFSPSDLVRLLDASPVIAAFNNGGVGGHVVLVAEYDGTTSGDGLMLRIHNPTPSRCRGDWHSYLDLLGGLRLGKGMWSATVHSIG
jgi:hypothetical protein